MKTNFAGIPRRWMLSLAVCGSLMLLAATANTPPRVGIVDVDGVQARSLKVQAALQSAAGPVDAIRADLAEKREQLEAAAEVYHAQQTALSEEAKEQRLAELNRLREEANELGRRLEEAINRAGGEDLERMRRLILAAVREVASEQGIEIVISAQSGVLYHSSRTDLTQAVVDRLDRTGSAP